MPDLPPELWYHVAQFLPDKTLRKCLSVNRALFEVCMRVRYQSVCFCKWDAKDMRRLEWIREPFVRKHIRRLSLVIPPDESPSKKSKKPLLLKHSSHAKLPFTKTKSSPILRSDFLNSLLATVQLLHRLDTVQICMGREKYTSTDDMKPFFSNMWESVGPKLRALRLRGTMHTLPWMVPSSHYFSNVEQLDFHIVARSTDVLTNTLVDAVMMETVSPLFTRLAPQLRSLQVGLLVFPGTANDLSSLFRYMPTCPLLERLSVRCMAPSLREADQLQRFLTDHGSNLTFFGLSLTVWNFQAADIMNRFLPETVADGKSLQKITVLDLEPYPFNMDNFLLAARNIVRCCHDTLEVLNLAQHVKVEEVSKILDIFEGCPRLSKISLQVLDPDIGLFDELSSRLPNLKQLTLHMHTYRGRSHLALAIRTLKTQLKSRKYTDWKLEDISIYYRWKSINPSMMACVARAVPSVKSFWGEGDMDVHPSLVQWGDYRMAMHLGHHAFLSALERGARRLTGARLPMFGMT